MPQIGQKHLMNALTNLTNYETNDNNNYNLSTFYSPMFTQVGTVSPTGGSLDCQRTQHLFNQQNMRIPTTALLLDNKLTMNYVYIPDLIYNIHQVSQCCIVATNAGKIFTCLKALLRQEILPMK